MSSGRSVYREARVGPLRLSSTIEAEAMYRTAWCSSWSIGCNFPNGAIIAPFAKSFADRHADRPIAVSERPLE
jgi:hypothetical protein